MKPERKASIRELARDLAQDSIVTNALARYIEQMVQSIHEDIVGPLREENEQLKARLRELEAGTSGCEDDPPAAPHRARQFKRMTANTTVDVLKTQIYGIEIGTMSHEETRIALGWALSELGRRTEGGCS